MSRTKVLKTWVSASLMLLAGACAPDPDSEAPAEAEAPRGEAITIWTEVSELFFEYPVLIAGAPGGPWAVHLTKLDGFGAVTEGRLTLEFEAPDGTVHRTIQEAPARAGVYSPAPSLPTAGMYDLVVLVDGPQLQDEIFVGPIQVHGSLEDIPELPEAEAVGISFLKEQQWPIEFATVEVGSRAVAPGIEVTGRLESAPGRVAEIAASVAGIVRWELNREAPVEGTWVSAGERMVQLSPVSGDAGFVSLKARAERLAKEVQRSERLLAAEAIPARRLEEARHDLEVVRAQLEALDADPNQGYLLSLASPIEGAVVSRTFVPGQRVEAGTSLLTIVDPRQLHVRLDVPAADAAGLAGVDAATVTPEGTSSVIRTTSLVGIGVTLDPVRRTVPVTFLVDNEDRSLKAGMLVTGRLLSGAPEAATAVPAEAILDEDGLLVAYVQISGESFERRAVTVGASDGQWTVVLSGVRRGERVVTRGQYQIKLSSLNTSEISDHGHPH